MKRTSIKTNEDKKPTVLATGSMVKLGARTVNGGKIYMYPEYYGTIETVLGMSGQDEPTYQIKVFRSSDDKMIDRITTINYNWKEVELIPE